MSTSTVSPRKSALDVIVGHIEDLNGTLVLRLEELCEAAASAATDHHLSELTLDVVRIQGRVQGLEMARVELEAREQGY